MLKINVNEIATKYNEEGTITSVAVGFQKFDGLSSFNATCLITTDDLEKGKTFDDMTPKMLEKLARQKLSDNILIDTKVETAEK